MIEISSLRPDCLPEIVAIATATAVGVYGFLMKTLFKQAREAMEKERVIFNSMLETEKTNCDQKINILKEQTESMKERIKVLEESTERRKR